MTTNIDVITGALRKAGVISEVETPSAEQSKAALKSMNRMIARWQFDGIELDYYKQETLSDETPVPDYAEDCVEYSLAVRLAGENGLTPSAPVITEAQDSYNALVRASLDDEVADMDHLPGSVRYVYDHRSG